jgi:outer membrane protein
LKLCLALALFAARPAVADSDPLANVLGEQGAGLGAVMRAEGSLYRGGGTSRDLLPLYLYDDAHFYLHAYRAGVKLVNGENDHVNVFFSQRFEGFPYDRVPSSLAGMEERSSGADFGVSYQHGDAWGAVYVEYLHDISDASSGNELRLGYNYDWQSGRWHVRPYLRLALRDDKLNDYYYGVRRDEATAERRAYMPGAGVNTEFGLYASYAVTERWRLLGGMGATHWSSGVRESPIVENRAFQYSGALGLMYDFSPQREVWPEKNSVIVKLMYGQSSDCNLIKIMALGCTSTHTLDNTNIAGVEVGRPFIRRLNGWPVDVVGYAGVTHHDEDGHQPDFWQANAYMKLFYYGFPWDKHVRTRIGFGAGVSIAQRVPYVEQRDQARRGRNTSKLLNYLDPSIDVSVGDLINVPSMGETYAGFGVAHRSGIFATSQLLGNVNGGSNYIYTYVEWKM